jgi:hypothetical protein
VIPEDLVVVQLCLLREVRETIHHTHHHKVIQEGQPHQIYMDPEVAELEQLALMEYHHHHMERQVEQVFKLLLQDQHLRRQELVH